jgi:hypothetical protein
MSSNEVEGPGRRYDWEQVRESFVEGVFDTQERGGIIRWLNLREVSELHEVPYNRCRERAAREGWNEARATFQAQLEHARQSERLQHSAREAADLDSKALSAAKAGIGLVLHRMQEIASDASKRAGEGQKPGSSWVEPVDSRELATLARAANEWRNLGAMALGLPTERGVLETPGGAATPPDLRMELMFDDPDDSRLTGILVTMERANLLPAAGGEEGHPDFGDPEVP